MTGEIVDPTGKHALFEAALAPASDPAARVAGNGGKAALFSASPRRLGTVVVECSSCKVRTRATLMDLCRLLVQGTLWLPFRRHQHWISCPACGRRVWCRIDWTA